MRKYVSLETQEIQKNAERRHRNEQNRMKMLFRNALASDVTTQNNNERQSYESNRVHAHNRQRRRNLLNKKASTKQKSMHSKSLQSTARGMNFRYHPKIPPKSKPIRPTSPGKRRRKRPATANSMQRKYATATLPTTGNNTTLMNENTHHRPMCTTCLFLRLDICVHDPKQFFGRAMQIKNNNNNNNNNTNNTNNTTSSSNVAAHSPRSSRRMHKRPSTSTPSSKPVSTAATTKVSTNVVTGVGSDAHYLTQKTNNPMVIKYQNEWNQICLEQSRLVFPKKDIDTTEDTATESNQTSNSVGRLRPQSAFDQQRERSWSTTTARAPLIENTAWSWCTLEYDQLMDDSESQWLNIATSEMKSFRSLEVYGIMKLREAKLISNVSSEETTLDIRPSLRTTTNTTQNGKPETIEGKYKSERASIANGAL